jgi:hypothetical protein
MRTEHDKALIQWASDVLCTLEDHQNWDPDTLEAISNSAHDFKLAKTDETGQFQAVNHVDFNRRAAQ